MSWIYFCGGPVVLHMPREEKEMVRILGMSEIAAE